MENALEQGSVQSEIAELHQRRQKRIAEVTQPITGVSAYPWLEEPVLDVDIDSRETNFEDEAEVHALASTLEPVRLGEGFERLRDLSDVVLQKHGRRPQVFLACIGPLAEHGARAAFAKNAFEAGGIEAIMSEPLEKRRRCAEGLPTEWTAGSFVFVQAKSTINR